VSLATIRHLVVLEIKQSKWTMLLLTAILFGLFALSISASGHLTTDQLLTDSPAFFTFIILLTVLIITVRPTVFRNRNISFNFQACKHLIHLQQLPIKKSTIILYRLITNYMLLIPLLIVYLITLYIVISPLQELLPLGNYLVFSILWLTICSIVLNIQVITDFGTNILFSYIYLIFIFFPIVIVGIILFYMFFDQSLFSIIVHICNNYPVITSITSLLVIGVSILISYHWSLKRIRKMDYLL